MMLFVKRYVVAFVVLLIAMSGYRLLVVPAIEPPPRAAAALPDFSGVLEGPQWWQVLFAKGAWQTDNPQIIQSKRGVVLLSKVYQQTGPRTLSLKPLTIVLPQSSPDESAAGIHDVLIISAEMGAEIHFEEDFNPSSSLPSVERGELAGLIEVTRRVHGDSTAYPWSFRTSHLSLNRNQVSTPHAVTIEWPEGVIEGHDMKLTLQGDLLNSNAKSASPWGPLRTLDLYHLDRLDMNLAGGGLWGSAKLDTPPGQPPLSTLPAHLKMSCGGRFSFDFTQSRANLVNGVHVVHQVGSLAADEFQSQEVMVLIDPPRKDSANLPNARPSSAKLGGVQIKVIEANGIDSLENFVGEQKVEIKAPTIGAFASAKRLRIDVLENRIELDGKLNRPGATQSTAWLKYMGYEFTAPRIDYDSDGQSRTVPTSAALRQHLGYLIASGAGELRMPVESATGQTLVRWQNSLEMRPTEIEGQQWVGLFGNVLVESALHGYMACEELQIWLRQNNSAQAVLPPTGLHSQGLPLASPTLGNSPRFVPERMRAVRQVELSTEQIKAKVDELSLALNFVNSGVSTDVVSSDIRQNGMALSDSAGRPMYQWVGPPTSDTGSAVSPFSTLPPGATTLHGAAGQSPTVALDGPGMAVSQVTPARPMNPMTIQGRSLNSTVIVSGKQSWVDSLTVIGPLQVTAQAAGPKQPGWNVVGDELQMATNPAGQVDMQITGQPARIALAEGSLEGPMIRFDQRNNMIWMDQPGEFTIPTSAFAAQPGSSASSIHWFEPPHCTWQGRMLFDGKVVRIEGDIRFDAAMTVDRQQFWWINGQSEVLQMELSEAVDLDDLRANRAQPLKVTVSQNVNILASQVDHNGNKKSRQQLVLPSLTFDIQSNELIGLGPGSIRSWHIAQNRIGQAASGSAIPKLDDLQGAHLVFRESMRGFLDRSEVYFQGKVELAAGPLATWEDAIDVTQMQRLKMDQIHIDCDLLKVYDTSGLSSIGTLTSANSQSAGNPATKAWEFVAKGNVNFAGKAESGDYEGYGSEVNYVQAKEQLTLLGEPRRSAHVIIKPAGSSQAQVVNWSVQHAVINPRIGSLESYKMGEEGINVQLQNPNNNPPFAPVPNGPLPNPRSKVNDFFSK